MILLTVGTQLAFPRLVEAMDRYAEASGEEIIAQVGTDSVDRPNLTIRKFMEPKEYDAIFTRARVVVSHAGIGTVLSAKRHGRPLILMPRRHALGEHRNDHQIATARALEDTPGLYIAWETSDLPGLLSRSDLIPAAKEMGPKHIALVEGIARFIASARPGGSPTRPEGQLAAGQKPVKDAK